MEKESFASLKKSPPALGGCPAWPRNRSTPSALPVRLTPDASYQTRLWLGVLCGVLLGLSNASFIWATRTIFSRLSPVPPIAALPVVPAPTAKALAVLSITETNLREWERRCSPPPKLARVGSTCCASFCKSSCAPPCVQDFLHRPGWRECAPSETRNHLPS